jgi:subtilisin family serine protease
MCRRSLIVCLIAASLGIIGIERTFAQGAQSRAHVPGELLVGFETDEDRDQLIQRLDETRTRLRARGEPPAAMTVERSSGSSLTLRIEFPEGVKSRLQTNPEDELPALEELAQQLKANDSKIKYAHPNWIMTIKPPPRGVPRTSNPSTTPQAAPRSTWPNDPVFMQGRHWHYMAPPTGMNAVNAWKAGNTGSKEVVVAVIDTGLVFDHSDIRNSGNFLRGQNMLSSLGRQGDASDRRVLSICPSSDPPSMELPEWHGTHVAGTIGAVGSNNGLAVAGTNFQVTVLPIRVIGVCGGTLKDEADAIRWAAGLPVEGMTRNNRPAQIINLSMGGGGDCTNENRSYERDAVAAARRAGAIIVVAAGNDDETIQNHSPASCPGVISVAASDRFGKLAYYSNFGAVTIMAPGGDMRNYNDGSSGENDGIFSVVKATSASRDGVGRMQGTSMATPHVSGAIALALAKHPDWRGKPDVVAQKLRASAFKLAPDACPKDKPCGAGLLDAVRGNVRLTVAVQDVGADPVSARQGRHRHATAQSEVDRGMLAMAAGGALWNTSSGHTANPRRASLSYPTVTQALNSIA